MMPARVNQCRRLMPNFLSILIKVRYLNMKYDPSKRNKLLKAVLDNNFRGNSRIEAKQEDMFEERRNTLTNWQLSQSFKI